MIEVDDERRYFRMPSFDTILKMLGMIAACAVFLWQGASWVESVNAYMASNEKWKGYEIVWFNRICEKIDGKTCVPLPENR